MIFTKREQWRDYLGIDPRLDRALRFLGENDISALPDGEHLLEGRDLRLTLSHSATRDPENATLETHREFIDIQYLLEGEELYRIGFEDKMTELIEDSPEKDLRIYRGPSVPLVLQPGQFVVLFPSDAHGAQFYAECPGDIRKGLFKVKISR